MLFFIVCLKFVKCLKFKEMHWIWDRLGRWFWAVLNLYPSLRSQRYIPIVQHATNTMVLSPWKAGSAFINGNSRILKWSYCTIFQAIFCGDIPLDRSYIGLRYGRYLQFRFLKWPLSSSSRGTFEGVAAGGRAAHGAPSMHK